MLLEPQRQIITTEGQGVIGGKPESHGTDSSPRSQSESCLEG